MEFLRVASLAIGAYDYLITLRAECRFYKTQFRIGHMTLSCILFILIRYISVALMVFGAYVWFETFTMESCRRWFFVPPVFKVLQVMISQLILGIRAYNLSRRSRRVGITLLALYLVTCTVQWVCNMYDRTVSLNSDGTQCHRSVNDGKGHFPPWLFYMAAIIYDSIVTAISFRYLLKYYFSAMTSVVLKITEVMICDGLGYFVLLTATNIFNLILFRTNEQTQAAGASLSYISTWIMTQRILIDLNEASIERQKKESLVTITRTVTSAPDVRRAIRSQLESNKEEEEDWTEPSLDVTSSAERGERLDVEVRVERTLNVQEHPWLLGRNLYRSRVPGHECETQDTWSTATHNTRDDAIRATRDPMMVTIR